MAAASAAPPGFLVDGLARVESALVSSVVTHDPFLTEVASHLIKAGGKRVRPAFAVAAAATVSTDDAPVTDEVILGGVAVELVHLGSLYHDDVIDEATTRRTVASVNARWGNLTAILAGDFLLAKASEIAASLGTEVAGLLAATIGRLCEGEVAELRTAYDLARTEEAYLDSIRGKTAALFSTSCRIGALVAGLPRAEVDVLTEFGDRYGIAFQIVDDILDVVATDQELGKPAGHDLVEGVYTLPVLRALAGDSPELRKLLGRPLSDEDKERARALVRGDGAVGAAIEAATEWVEASRGSLATLRQSDSTAWLAGAAGELLTRVTTYAAAV
ncbi:MAG: polyprenyl synthetase family protein [Acidimicrobiales bacterium]